MATIETLLINFESFMWGTPLLILLLGGGIFFALYSRFLPYRHIGHAFGLLTGKYDDPKDEGELKHREALATALSGTIGMGNIAGVAMAITVGGPGAVFWMWVSAILGVATKFYTCTLGVMYRGKDSEGNLQGGPMYIIREALPKPLYPLAILFAIAGLFGVLPVFQANQIVEALREEFIPRDWYGKPWQFNLLAGILLAGLTATVVFGGLKRMAHVAVAVVPTMVLIYFAMTFWVLAQHISELPHLLASIVRDAFTATSVGGGILGVMIVGISRGVFSNEAGIGTEVMAHGAAKTHEPIREGLVAMLGPVIDTMIVCTCTALVILATGVWQSAEGMQGTSLTLTAFGEEMGSIGKILLGCMIFCLGSTTIFAYWYYGAKCLGFLIGAKHQHYFKYFHILMVIVGASLSIDAAFSLLSGMYALMAIPTMTATLILAPKVNAAAKVYFGNRI